MTVDKCPICKEQHDLDRTPILHGDPPTETDLCEECDSVRFFLDDEREIEYRQEVRDIIVKLKVLFKEEYDDILHRKTVEQLVRCEINVKRYDQLISNDNEAPQTAELLKSERNQWNKLADKLNMTIAKIRGDTKKMEHDFTDDFRKYLGALLGDENEDSEEEESPSEE